ncbi:melatonin receptor type 1B-A-like [Amphiura filiformis]|uniref:melatonin receptor type 1B-A-like n=1 Tax=Amphiura filiformis TaxID=82378 RepID=UPI003B2198D9
METVNATTNGSINFPMSVNYWEQIFTAILTLLISVTGIIGNTLIILAVAFSQKLQTSTNAFVTSLAVADLLTSIFLIWFSVSILGHNEWPIPNAIWLCDVTGFTIYACRGTSLYTLAAIAVNRLILITKSYTYSKIFTSWKLVMLIAIPWIIPWVAFIILILAGVGQFGYDIGDLSCSAIGSAYLPDIMAICIAAIGFPIPLFLVVFSYTGIYIYLRRHFHAKKSTIQIPSSHGTDDTGSNALDLGAKDRQLQVSTPDLSDNANMNQTKRYRQISRDQIKITKNLFLIVCSIYVCFLPYFICLLLIQKSYIRVHFYARIVTFANSAINFAIHTSKHPDFNMVIRHMVRGSYSNIPQPSRLLRFLLSKWK